MATKKQRAFINAAIANPEVAKKILDIIDWYEAGGSGGGGDVVSVNGQQGVVVLDTDDITESGAKYFTDARAKAAAVVNSTVGNEIDQAASVSALKLYAVPLTQKGANNGVATLDAGGKVPVSQLPNSVMTYEGTYNASTNTPALADGIGDAGSVYIVSVGGTQDFGSGDITFAAGDWVVYNGSIWQKSSSSATVVSVNGQTGVVVLTTANIAEDTNLYFTEQRAQDALASTISDINDDITQEILDRETADLSLQDNIDTKANIVLPVNSQYVYVNYLVGNDTTGTGANDNPFKTINGAISTINDASLNKPYVIGLLGAWQVETSDILIKPFVHIVGMGQRATYIRSPGFNIKPHSSHSTGTSWVLLKNFYLGGGTGINWDLQSIGGSNSALIIENLTITGALTYKGRNAGGGDYLEMYTGIQFGTVTLDSVYSQIQTWELISTVNITNSQSVGGYTATINNSNFNNSIVVNNTSISLNNCGYPGTSGLTTTNTVTIDSYRGVPPVARRTFSIGTTYNEYADVAAGNFIDSFNSTTDWTFNLGFYEHTVSAATHGKGLNPEVQVYELNGAIYEMTIPSILVNASGDVTIQINQTPDLRFTGKLIIS